MPSFAEIQEKVDEIREIETMEKGILVDLLMRHRHIFKKIPGRFKIYEHKLIVSDETPFVRKSYPIPLEPALKGLKFVIDFVDDLLVVSHSFLEHVKHLEILFTRMEEEITVNFKKFELCRKEIKVLGHIITTKEI